MDTRQLAAFCAVVERKSFSQAAERLGVTQPAVSLQVRSLEKRLGTQLLDRSGRRVEPTEAGLRLYRGAQRLLALEEQLVAEVAGQSHGALSGDLSIGASTGPAAIVVPLLLCEFQQANPGLRVSLTVSDTQSVVDLVADRELELGIVGAARRHRTVRFEPFFEDEVILACPPGHAFGGRTVTLDDLRSEQLIVMQEGAGVRQIVEDELRARGSRLRDLDVRLELGLQESVRSAVQAGYGVTFISRSAVESELAAGTLVAARVEGLDATREISLVRASRRTATRAAEAFVEFARTRLPRATVSPMIVRWGLHALPELLGERPFLVASERWSGLVDAADRWSEIPSHRIKVPDGCDGIVAIGGGSAIDTAKAASAASGLPLVSVPTTYSGAEWTEFFGVRDPERRLRGGGAGAHLAGIVYEPNLTLELPRAETVGTALNGLAHCAEALYVEGHSPEADIDALAGARLIGRWLPQVVERPTELESRTELLRGACHGGAALGGSFLALGHAMAQALGGRYGLPHGALNALCLPPALRFNAAVAREAIERFGAALGATDPAGRVEELARLGGFARLRDLGIPVGELGEVATAVVDRAGAKANPRQATVAEVEELLRSIW